MLVCVCKCVSTVCGISVVWLYHGWALCQRVRLIFKCFMSSPGKSHTRTSHPLTSIQSVKKPDTRRNVTEHSVSVKGRTWKTRCGADGKRKQMRKKSTGGRKSEIWGGSPGVQEGAKKCESWHIRNILTSLPPWWEPGWISHRGRVWIHACTQLWSSGDDLGFVNVSIREQINYKEQVSLRYCTFLSVNLF